MSRNPFRDPVVWDALPTMAPETAEALVHYVVCANAEDPLPPGYEGEREVFTTCAECGRAIKHRAVTPRRPPKLCVPCAIRKGAGFGPTFRDPGPR